MKVRELIRRLSKLPPEARVIIPREDYWDDHVKVKGIRMDPRFYRQMLEGEPGESVPVVVIGDVSGCERFKTWKSYTRKRDVDRRRFLKKLEHEEREALKGNAAAAKSALDSVVDEYLRKKWAEPA